MTYLVPELSFLVGEDLRLTIMKSSHIFCMPYLVPELSFLVGEDLRLTIMKSSHIYYSA